MALLLLYAGYCRCILCLLGINYFIKDEIISFVILCVVVRAVTLYRFYKKARSCLGNDIAYIQGDLYPNV